MGFTEEWFGTASQEVLAGLATEVADVPGRVVEIGSWEGRSSVALANAIAPRVVDCVDTWSGSPGEPSGWLAGRRDVYSTWQTNISELTAGNAAPHRMNWRTYREASDDPVALVFIDAEHSYQEVHDTIEAFLPLLSPGAVMCGDDVHHPPVLAAVLDALPPDQTQQHATLWIYRHEVTDGY